MGYILQYIFYIQLTQMTHICVSFLIQNIILNTMKFEEVNERLRTLYFYEDLTKSKYYQLHIKRCHDYFKFIKLKEDILNKKFGNSYSVTEKNLNLPQSCISRYLRGKKPYLYRLASSAPKIKLNEGMRLLPLKSKKGGHSYSNFINAPLKIKSYKDVLFILNQLGGDKTKIKVKEKAFAYVLGMMISDTSKPKGYRFSNQCLLSLTRKHSDCLKIGNGLCNYFKILGINAHRIKDDSRINKRHPHGHYRWITEKSPFIKFLTKTCLGMREDDRTTYDGINMEWLFDCPKNFLVNFFQGICDGDGTAHNFWRVEISCHPNQILFMKLLKKIGINSYLDGDAISIYDEISVKNALKLPIFLNAEWRLEKLKRIVSMINNRKVVKDLDNNIKEKILKLKKSGMSGGQVSDHLFDVFGIGVHPSSINGLYSKIK